MIDKNAGRKCFQLESVTAAEYHIHRGYDGIPTRKNRVFTHHLPITHATTA